MAKTGTQLIIANYMKNGGHTMDEDKFQTYKRLLLHFWFEKYYTFLCAVPYLGPACPCNENNWRCKETYPEDHIVRQEALPARYLCMKCSTVFAQTEDIDRPIAHLRVHYPELFQDHRSVEENKSALAAGAK